MRAVSAITILRFLLSAEDSSAPAPSPGLTDASFCLRIMKLGVWIAVSVAAALLLGKL